MNVNKNMEFCFSNFEMAYRILFQLDSRGKEQAALVCRLWNQIITKQYMQPLYQRASDLMDKFPLILMTYGYYDRISFSVWQDNNTLLQGFTACKTKEEAYKFFKSIITPVSQDCGLKALKEMERDIKANLSLVHYNSLIDQIIPRKDQSTQVTDLSEDWQMIEEYNPKEKGTFDQLDANDENQIPIQILKEDPSDREEPPVGNFVKTSVKFGGNKGFKPINDLRVAAFQLSCQENIDAGMIKDAHNAITDFEIFKGGIDGETCFFRGSLAIKICQRDGLKAAIDYLQVPYKAGFNMRFSFLDCFKTHLNDDEKRLSDPEANLQFLDNISGYMIDEETFTLCSDAAIKVFLKHPKDFDKTLDWVCDPYCSSTTRYDRIRACINSIHVWPSLPLESMKKLNQQICALSLFPHQKDDIYYNFILNSFQNTLFSKELEVLIFEMFKEIDNLDTILELITELVESHINMHSVALIREMILYGLKNHRKHDVYLIDCMEWYFTQQKNFDEACMTISKMEQPLLRLLMQGRSIKFLLEIGDIDQAINLINQQGANMFIQTRLSDHVIILCKQEKYYEASQFIDNLPEQCRRTARATFCQVSPPFTEEDIHDLELLNTVVSLPIENEFEILIALDGPEGIEQQSYRDAAQFFVMQKLLQSQQIEKAMDFASLHFDNLLIERAIIGYFELLSSEHEYDEGYVIIDRVPNNLDKEKLKFLFDYMKSLDN